MLDLKQLFYFVTIAQELNITRAAKKLNISQPPLTRQLQLLEKELGVKLFTRTMKGVELTDAGMVPVKGVGAPWRRRVRNSAISCRRSAPAAAFAFCTFISRHWFSN